MRAMNLANALVDAGHDVVVWSSAFYHQEKSHRARSYTTVRVAPRLEIRLIPSPGYARNIGPGRLWDHAVLGWRLAQRLRAEPSAPDVAFVGYPPIETAAVMTRWLSRRGVPSLLDAKDQWPTIFTKALPVPLRPLGELLLMPYFYLARRAMREATGISAMAGGFLDWALAFSGRARSSDDCVVALTTPDLRVSSAQLREADAWWDARGIPADGRPRACFIGSHSQAFDMAPVIAAARELSTRSPGFEFVICGAGECTDQWRTQAGGLDNVVFPGWVDRAQIESLAQRSRVALAPYHNTEDFMMSVPNKVIDSFALGLPVLSPLRGEVAQLIAQHGVGWTYGAATGPTLVQCLDALAGDPSSRDLAAQRARRLYDSTYSFASVYGGLVNHLEGLARSAKGSAAHGG